MKLAKKHWMACAYALPLICGFAAVADAQPEASHVITRSNTSAASASQPVDASASTALRDRIEAALHAEPYLDDRHIDVSVENGTVVLQGLVFGDADLTDALRVARKAAGGAPVIDNLSLYQEQRR